MAEDQDQDRTEDASPKRKEEARKKGQVAKSQELASVTVLLGSVLFFYFGAGNMVRQLMDLLTRSLQESALTVVNRNTIQAMIFGYVYDAFVMMFPFLLTIFLAALAANYLQVGFLFSAEAMAPKFSKIDPMKGFQRLFALRSVAELVKNIFKLVIVSAVAWWTIEGEIENLAPLMDRSVWEIMVYIGDVSFTIIVRTCWVLLVLAVLDYLYQRWEHERGLKMSKQEVKDEYKQTEGDPLLKSRIRRVQREMARKRMMSKVPKADVVITNPTHIAVALKYDQAKMSAPVVVAKGAGLIAEKIKELARGSSVPIVENKPLARMLFKLVEVNKAIPENLYKAVAEVLAYVYNLKNYRMAG